MYANGSDGNLSGRDVRRSEQGGQAACALIAKHNRDGFRVGERRGWRLLFDAPPRCGPKAVLKSCLRLFCSSTGDSIMYVHLPDRHTYLQL